MYLKEKAPSGAFFVWARDPRNYQLLVLASLLLAGLSFLDFPVSLRLCLGAFLVAFLSQYSFIKFFKIKELSFKSAFISTFSILILLRSNYELTIYFAVFLSIASKFLIRFRNKHIFNPSLFGIISVLFISPFEAWVSAGQWGTKFVLGFFVVSAGIWVIHKSNRPQLSLLFLSFFLLLLFLRSLWLGDPLAIFLHQISNGAFLIFSFFMISDPKTAPDQFKSQLLFILSVGILVYFFQFHLYWNNPLLWGLFFSAFLVPLLDLVFKAKRYNWPGRGQLDQASNLNF